MKKIYPKSLIDSKSPPNFDALRLAHDGLTELIF
jgi:hypothetical protein